MAPAAMEPDTPAPLEGWLEKKGNRREPLSTQPLVLHHHYVIHSATFGLVFRGREMIASDWLACVALGISCGDVIGFVLGYVVDLCIRMMTMMIDDD